MQAKSLSLAISFVLVGVPLAGAGCAWAQCCQNGVSAKGGVASTTLATSSESADRAEAKPGSTAPVVVMANWIVHATKQAGDALSGWVGKMTFADYSTEWSSWCAGNRGLSGPCATRCCVKPALEKPSTPQTRCCQQPCSQGGATGDKSKGS